MRHSVSSIAFAISLSFAVVGCDSGSLGDIRSNMEAGRAALANGQAAAAEQAFRAVTDLDPAADDAIYLRAQALEQLRRHAEAYALYRHLIQLHPDSMVYQRDALRLEVTAQRVDSAQARLSNIAQDDKLALSDTERAYWSARIALIKNDAAGALRELAALEASASSNDAITSDWRFYAARAQLALGDPENKAAALIEKQLALTPDHRLSRQLKADLDLRVGNNAVATRTYEKLFSENNADIAAALRLGILQTANGQLDDAGRTYASALQHRPKDPSLLTAYGELLYQRDDGQGLAGLIGGIRTETSNLEGVRSYLQGLKALLDRDPANALEPLERASLLLQDKAQIWLALGNAQLAMQEEAKARLSFQEALRRDGQYVGAILQLIRLDLAKGDFQRPMNELRNLERAFPENNSVQALLARAEILSGDSARAIQRLQARLGAGESLPISAEIQLRSLLADALIAEKQPDQALDQYRMVLSKQPDDAQAGVRAARLLANAGNLVEAKSLLTPLAERGDADARTNLIMLAMREKSNAEAGSAGNTDGRAQAVSAAIAALREVVNDAPRNIASRFNLGLLAMTSGDFELAETQLLAAEKLAPQDPLIQQNLGVRAQLTGDFSEAEKRFQRALRLQNDLLLPKLGLAEIALANGKPRDAKQQASAALADDAKSLRALRAKAAAEVALSDLPAALDSLSRALQLVDGAAVETNNDQAKAEILSQRGRVLLLQNQPAQAKRDFDQALALTDGRAGELGDAVVGLVDAYRFLGKPQCALQKLDERLVDKPNNALLLRLKGTLQLQAGDYAAAVSSLQSALDGEPDNLGTRLFLARAQQRVGDSASAIQTLRSVGDRPTALRFLLASLYQQTGAAADAVGEYRQIVANSPNYAPALNNLANALLAVHRQSADRSALDEALEMARRARLIAPDSAAIADTLGLVQMRIGASEEALRSFQAAAKLAPGNSEIRDHLTQAQAILNGEPVAPPTDATPVSPQAESQGEQLDAQ